MLKYKYLKYKKKYLSVIQANTNKVDTTVDTNSEYKDSLYNSIINRKKAQLTDTDINLFTNLNSASTYGYMHKEAIPKLIEKYYEHTKSNKASLSFCDLGCGEGVVLVSAALYNNDKFHLIDGIELSLERYQASKSAIDKLIADKNLDNINSETLQVKHGNLLDISLSKYDIIFVSNLCFGNSIQNKLAEKLTQMNSNTIAFVSKKFTETKGLRYIGSIDKIPMSWNKNHTLHMYKI